MIYIIWLLLKLEISFYRVIIYIYIYIYLEGFWSLLEDFIFFIFISLVVKIRCIIFAW
jgi:hypothetical protein